MPVILLQNFTHRNRLTLNFQLMAQVCGGSSYDYDWDRVHETALRTVRRAADIWAADGSTALAIDSLVAILLQIYLSEPSASRNLAFETRGFDAWMESVKTPSDEILDLRPNISAEIHRRAVSSLKSELSFAVEQWQMGNPELPTSAEALNVLEFVLFANRLTHRPQHFKSPTTFLTS